MRPRPLPAAWAAGARGALRFTVAAGFACFCAALPAAERVVDLAVATQVHAELRWHDQPVGPLGASARRGAEDERFHEMTAVVPMVEHRLDLRRWKGRNVRIFYAVPTLVDGMLATRGFVVQWETTGVLQSGRARPGERVLVFAGRVGDDMLVDRFRLSLTIDSRFFSGRLKYQPAFELEVI